MAISTPPFGQTISSLAQDPSNKTDGPFGQTISELAKEKNQSSTSQLNQSILQASLSLSESNGDSAMALLYKTALDGINKALEAEFGDNAIQTAYEQGVDVSPEATADRIVQGSTSFFAAYYANHQDLTAEEAAESFTNIIRGGIDQGFAEARDVLEGLNVLAGNIASNIDKTYELVQQGLQSFLNSFSSGDETLVE